MDKKRGLIISIIVLFMGLLITAGSYAFWTWNSDTDKQVVFNTSKEISNYIKYDAGKSTFEGELVPKTVYSDGIHSTISVYKTEPAANVNLVATIYMDVKSIGEAMSHSDALKWVVTTGNSENPGSIVAQGNFVGSSDGDTLTLAPNITVTSTQTYYTIWIWLDYNADPIDDLTGNTLDTVVWTEINQVEGLEDKFEITRIEANYQNISATVVNYQHQIVDYMVIYNDATEPNENTVWPENIDSSDYNNIYNLNTSVNQTGTYYVWFKDNTGSIVGKSVTVTSTDNSGPICTYGDLSNIAIGYQDSEQINLTCIDSDTGIGAGKLYATDFVISNNSIIITNIESESVQNGYTYTITLSSTGVESGYVTLTLKENSILNYANVGNEATTSSPMKVNLFKIYLDHLDATEGGTEEIYFKYNDGAYFDSAYTKKMTSNANRILVPSKIGYSFVGYYDGNTQMLDANGYVTSNLTSTKYTSHTTLIARFVDDIAPTGGISTDVDSNAVTATVIASDEGSGLAGTYAWKVSSNQQCDSNTTGFSGEVENTTYTFNINASGTYYICVKVADNDGNIGYVFDQIVFNDVTFSYTGNYQTYTVPQSGYYKIETLGAQGQTTTKAAGGLGGYSSGYLYMNAGEIYYIYVGSQDGYNGGGTSAAGNGGGATDIRYFGSNTPSSSDLEWNSALGLNSRIMVAGGGGGAGSATNEEIGGTGGGLVGGRGKNYSSSYNGGGYGGSQTKGGAIGNTSANGATPGTFAVGGNGGAYGSYGASGAGGGGYYGGGGGSLNDGAGGGGSSFISGFAGVNAITSQSDTSNPRNHTNDVLHYSNKYFIDAEMQSGFNSGNGKVRITYAGEVLTKVNPDLNNVRYIKDCISGNSVNTNNDWVELQAIKDGINVAKGKVPTGSSSQISNALAYSYVTDGIIDNTTATTNFGQSSSGGMQCITVDLNSLFDLDEIAVWHYYLDGRTYNNNVTYVSSDGDSWVPVIKNNDAETSIGKRVSAWDQPLDHNETSVDFTYTGNYQEFSVPTSGFYKFETWGAQGGGSAGAKGGYSSGYIHLNANEKLYIYVGQAGTTEQNLTKFNSGTSNSGGYNGGGATDIRYFNNTIPTASDLEWNSVLGINSRIMVAAGGGSGNGGVTGVGGDLIGTKGNGTVGGSQTAFGASQSTSYTTSSFGIANGGCSGGNGYYPGGGATCSNGAGGGSSFISGYAGVNAITSASDRTHTNNTNHYSGKYFLLGEMQTGINSGNGKVKISYTESLPVKTNTDLNNVRYIKDCINGNGVNANNDWVEIQAIKDGVNLAKGKNIVGTSTAASGYEYTYVTDGMIDNTTTTTNFGRSSVNGLQCVTVDLGSTYNLDEIAVWHYFTDGRTYKNNVTYASNDGVFWHQVINNSNAETVNGKRVNAWDLPLENNDSFISYNGSYTKYTAAQTGYYKLETWGAASGTSNNTTASKVITGRSGGYSSGYIYLNQGDKIYIYAGGSGTDSTWGVTGINAGGYNGGGNGYSAATNRSGSGGGGATDIRYFGDTTPSASDLEWNSVVGLNSRIMVAGGGGGSYTDANSGITTGGYGGNLIGTYGARTGDATYSGPGGGTQTSGGFGNTTYNSLTSSTTQYIGSFGIGGTGTNSYGGGGGGYYGGGSGNYNGGGGGSSFISGYAGVNAITSSSSRTHTATVKHYSNLYFLDGEMQLGVNSGSGKAKITYVGVSLLRTNTDLNNVRYIKDCINGNSVNANNDWIELQAIKDGVNIAKGKSITGSGLAASATLAYTYITDGLIDNTTATTNFGRSSVNGLQCVTVDLSSTYNLDEIAVWHYFDDGRTYYDNVTYVSSNGTSWVPVINNNDAETSNGKRVNAWDEPLENNDPVTDIINGNGYIKYTVPQTGYYKLEAWGAEGGAHPSYTDYATSGKGGYSSGYIHLNQNDNLYIYVGGKGRYSAYKSGVSVVGGYNGGGNAYGTTDKTVGSGGGATDIRYFGSTTPTDSDLLWDSTLGLNSRIMIAGGGGGGSYQSATNYGSGGGGGTLVGSIGTQLGSSTVGKGGSQTAGGAGQVANSGFGIGGFRPSAQGSGGGGGYYGGGNSNTYAGGAGGSSFISGYAGVNAITSSSSRTHTATVKHYSNLYFLNGKMQSGVKEGSGDYKITYVGANLPSRTNTDLNNVRYIKDCIKGNSVNINNDWIELQAIKNGVNIAKGILPTGTSVQKSTALAYSFITDGIIDNTTATTNFGQSTDTGSQCITIDLSSPQNLDEIAVWHYFADGRTYNDNVTYVSSDGSQWIPVINNNDAETGNGKHVTAWDQPLEDNDPIVPYTGTRSEYTVPQTGYYKLETWGAAGGNALTKVGGKGSYASGYMYLNTNDNLYVNVGKSGGTISNATLVPSFNGGGGATTASANDTAGGGGGATDIRFVGTNNSIDLRSRLIVAGGGGGAYYHSSYNSDGGNAGSLFTEQVSLGVCTSRTYTAGAGATQITGGGDNRCATATVGGTFGIGGTGTSYSSGGGGGWYGGGAGYAAGGGGGSSFISGYAGVNAVTYNDGALAHTDELLHFSNKYLLAGEMQAGVNSGAGKAKITYVGSTFARTNTALNNVRYIKDCINGNSVNTDNIWYEIQAVKNGVNIAKNKFISGTVYARDEHPYINIVRGTIDDSTIYGQSLYTGYQCVIVDLDSTNNGVTYDLDEIAVWHSNMTDVANNKRVYENVTYVSSDRVNWIPVIDNNDVETINGKRVSAWKSAIKNKVTIMYHANGGKLNATYGEGYGISNNYVTLNGSKKFHTIYAGSGGDPYNYNNSTSINLTRNGYSIVEGEEWNTMPDGSGTTYSQETVYEANDYCNASSGNCTVTLYANWVKNRFYS